MEVTEASTVVKATGSRVIADLIPNAAAAHAEHVAVRYKRDGAWHDVTYAQLAEIVDSIGLGLIDLGVQPGERVCILANTRPEWSYVDLAASSAGAVVVPIYPTNSPEECLWVISDSGASTIVCENEEQLAKVAAIRERLPDLSTIIIIDPVEASQANGSSSAITLDEVRERGSARPAEELAARRAEVAPEDSFTFIYTSGTTGPPKGCVLTHGNYRSIIDMVCEAGEIERRRGHLPLPAARPLLRPARAARGVRPRQHARLLRRRHQADRRRADRGQADLPSLGAAHLREGLHARPRRDRGPAARGARAVPQAMLKLGMRVRDLMSRGEPMPEELQKPFEEAEEALFKNVRAIFGGRIRHGTSGAAPIAREILEFFWACGVPVLEGYGMTETATAATISTVENHRFGTVGRALPGVELRIAEDGEILIKGPNIFKGYHNQASTSFGAVEDGWLHTGDLGSIDEDGYLSITGRKKDIIITAGGKNLTPGQHRERPQTVPLDLPGGHARRPAPLPGRADHARRGRDPDLRARTRLAGGHARRSPRDPAIHALIQQEIDRVNAKYAQVEQVKKFAILDHDLSQATGELTPTLKVKRNVVNERYAELFDSLYAS